MELKVRDWVRIIEPDKNWEKGPLYQIDSFDLHDRNFALVVTTEKSVPASERERIVHVENLKRFKPKILRFWKKA